MKTYLKTLFVILFFTGIFNISYSQPLTGSKNIPGDYATLSAAITDLNTNGVGAGGVTFTIAAGYTETFATATTGTITATGTALNPIVFQKGVGTPNPLITASGLGTVAPSSSTGQHGDGIIIIVGGDYITFDGINLQENPGTLGNARSEYGYYLKLASLTDACKNVTIKNCSISLDQTDVYSFGIFVSSIYQTTTPSPTSTGGRDENIKIYSNTITNCYGGILAQGFGSLSQDLWSQNIEIGVDGGNTITNFGVGTSTAYGILANYQQNLKIANNIINGGSGIAPIPGAIYGINTAASSSNSTNSNVDIYNNNITLAGGNSTFVTNAGIANGMGGSGTNNTVNIYNNTIENCTCPTGPNGTTIQGIVQSASAFNINIYNNIVRNNTKPGTGAINGIINSSSAANGSLNMYGNSVYGNSNTAIGPVVCISATPNAVGTSNYIYGNTVYNNSSAGATVTGLTVLNGLNNYIYKNNIYGLSSTTATAALVYGINAAGGTNSYYYNNFVSDLKAPAATNATSIAGINISAGTNAYAYNNTVYLNASSTGASFGTAAVYVTSTVPFVEMKNNIFVNASTPGTGKTVAFKRSAVGLTTYSGNSNYNYFYAGTPSASNLIFSDLTNFKQTMTDYFAFVTPRDGSSFTESPPPFVNIATTPYDLHIQTTVNTQCESGGSVITIPNITQDFDGDARYPNLGYPIKVGYPPTAPDVGADEFAGQQNDLTPPSISYVAITNKPAGTSLTLNNFAPITDPSGVNTSPGTAPRLYFKRTIDANLFLGNTSGDDGWKWVETSSGSSPFSFTIDYTLVKGGSVSGGDIIQYFVVAQDNAGTPHVGINAGSFSATPASVDLILTPGLTISSPINSYTLTATTLSGVINVGTGGAYTTLTGAGGLFSAINAGVVSGNITVNIISDISTETGANALNQFTEYPDGSNFTITIQPDAATNRTISGSSTNGLIKLNGADRVTIDGRFSGSGNYLTIQNTNTVANTAAIHLISLGTGLGAVNNTIRNCNIKAGINSVTSTFGIFAGGATISTSGTGANNNYLTIQNNNISKCYYGIYAAGVATTGELSNLNISNNTIGSSTASDYVTGTGINVASASGPVVSGNEIFNLIFDGNKQGINFGTTVYNASISKNKIHGLGGIVSSSKNCVGIYFSQSTAISNNTIDNNIIYDMSNIHNAGSNYGPYGIWIVGGTTFNIYYNSISLTGALGGTPVTASTSSCLWISTLTTNMSLRNNIFYNAMTGLFPRTFTFGSVTGTTFANINYNDYYSNSSYFAYLGVVIPTFTAWQTTTGQDANSKNIIPDFQSNTDLRPGLTSGLLNSATPILGFATDILGTARSVSTPTMGAYEQGVDASGPVITYTSFLNTSSTSNRTLSNVTMTDPGGVSSSPKPRMYYKKTTNANAFNDNTNGTDGWKYVESNGTTSPFDFTTDYSLLNGGAPGTGTTVQYFVVAQDMDITPYVSINSGTFAVTPSSVTLTSAAFPIGGTINSYNITNALSGIVTVGTGGTYPTLTGAGGFFAAVNSSSIGGNIILSILSDLTEDNTTALNEFFNDGAKTNFTITIQPGDATMKVISGLAANTANGLVTFNGCKGVTIDGRYGGSGKYLTFRNLNVDNLGNNNSVIAMRNGSSQNTVQYCILEGGTTSNTCGVVFFDFGTNTGNKITDCDIKNSSAGKPYNGIYSGNLLNIGNDITRCNIYDFTTNGICIDASGGQIIDSNNIYLTAPSASGPAGIFIANAGVTKILKNYIHDLDSQVGSNGRTNGIYYNPGSSPNPANISIENNFISLVATVTNNTVWGININSTILSSNYLSIYYNSIYIGGSVNNATTSQAVCLYLQNATMNGYVQKNNIFQCNRIFTGGGAGKNYAVFVTNAPSFVSDYNDYYVNGTPGVIGYWYGAEFTTIGDWRATTGQDVNTVYGDPMFISPSNLHIQTSVVSPVSNAGTPITGITTDIDNDTRSLTTPDIGADEYTYASPALNLGLTAMLSGYCNGTTMNFTKSVRVELHNSTTPYALIDSQTVTLSTSGTANPLFTLAANGTPYYIVLRDNNGLETWSATPQTFTGSALSYDFTSAATQAFGSNMLLIGTKWCIISGDANQDGSVDALDRSACWNDRNLSGIYATDLNGDGTVDALDRSIAWNNRNLSVAKPVLMLSPVNKGVKQDNKGNNGKTKGTFDLKLDGSNSKKVNKK